MKVFVSEELMSEVPGCRHDRELWVHTERGRENAATITNRDARPTPDTSIGLDDTVSSAGLTSAPSRVDERRPVRVTKEKSSDWSTR